MFVYKDNIDDAMLCEYLFALKVLDTDKVGESYNMNHIRSKLSKSIRADKASMNYGLTGLGALFKESIAALANKEMKTGDKFSIREYRSAYTDTFNTEERFKDLLNPKTNIDHIKKLNKIFGIFSDSIFIGYNVPVDIPISKTNVVYRDFIDFLLVKPNMGDDGVNFEDTLVIVEIDDLSSDVFGINKYKYFPHYKMPYSHIAASMDKDVEVYIIDPENMKMLHFGFKPSLIKYHYDELKNLLVPFASKTLIRNLHHCSQCEKRDICKTILSKEELNSINL